MWWFENDTHLLNILSCAGVYLCRLALQAVAGGADLNTAYRTPRAQRLVKDTTARARNANATAMESPRACGDVTVLHAAAAMGCGKLMEFLLQNGATLQHADAYGLNPLHYAIVYDAVECAKLLLKRAPELKNQQDVEGRTAMDIAMGRGRISDEELFVMLS